MLTQHFKTHHLCHIDRMGDILYVVSKIPHARFGMTLQRYPGSTAISLLNKKSLN